MKLHELSFAEMPSGYLQGSRRNYTPAILCPNCGWRMFFAVSLPSVDVSKTGMHVPGKPVTPEVFRVLVEQLAPQYPTGFPVQQQQGLGPSRVESRGKLEDMISMAGPGICFFKTEVLERLNKSGIHPLTPFPVEFKKKERYKGHVVEVQPHGLVSFSVSVHPTGQLRECLLCGQINLRQLDSKRIAIKRSSVPTIGDFFAVKEWGGAKIVTERFKECASRIIRNIAFREIPILEE